MSKQLRIMKTRIVLLNLQTAQCQREKGFQSFFGGNLVFGPCLKHVVGRDQAAYWHCFCVFVFLCSSNEISFRRYALVHLHTVESTLRQIFKYFCQLCSIVFIIYKHTFDHVPRRPCLHHINGYLQPFLQNLHFVLKKLVLQWRLNFWKVQKIQFCPQTNAVFILRRLQWNVLGANESVSRDIELSALYYREHLTDTSNENPVM